MKKGFYKRVVNLEKEEEKLENKNIEEIYKNSLFEIKDINKKLFDLMTQRNALIKNNQLIKIINNITNTYKDILKTKFYHWYDISIKIKETNEYKIVRFIYKKYTKLKETRIQEKLINLLNNLDYISDLQMLRFYLNKWNIKCSDLSIRERTLNNCMNLIDLKILKNSAETVGHVSLIKSICDSIYVARAINFFDNVLDLYNKKISFNNYYFLGFIITKGILYGHLKKYLNTLRLNCKIMQEKEANLIIEDLNEKIKKLDKNNALKALIEKDEEIKKLKDSLSRFPFQLKKGEKIISVIFTSINQKINRSIICKDTDIFNNVVNSLYNKNPEYRKIRSYFTCKGETIQEYQTLQELKINDGDVILMNQFD